MNLEPRKLVFVLAMCMACSSFVSAQDVSYDKTVITVPKSAVVDLKQVDVDWMPKLYNVEMPLPGSSRYMLNQIKQQSAAKYPRKEMGIQSWNPSGPEPIIGKSFPIAKTVILPNDTIIQYIAGGTPNDNTLAISDSGIVLASFNSSIFVYDTNRDTLVMPITSFTAFSSQFPGTTRFDPKTLYDPIEDRFILVFLIDNFSNSSLIVVGFSTTNDPSDPWNLYALPGNPFNDTTWTDYPAIAVTKDELFITGNQIKEGVSWQVGFRGSLIWQIDKQKAYAGDTALTSTLWSNIRLNDTLIRNLHLVQGGSWPAGPNQYLLSNRNFSIINDSIFLLEITGNQYDTSSILKIQVGKSNVPYGVPPKGRQDHIDSMATNDARVLGAFLENGEIQYVSVTVDTLTGFAAIYHGFINDLDMTPVFTATILVDDSLDLGYPNIAYTGSNSCSRQAIIGLDHTSPERNPGVSALQYHSNGTYSKLISLKEAEGPIKKSFTVDEERWGDYFGIQRRYNEGNTVWTAGFYGKANNSNYTWISELTAEEELPLEVSITDANDMSKYTVFDGSLSATVSSGVPPYTVQWNDPDQQTSLTASGLGAGTYKVTIVDDADCIASDSMTIKEPLPVSRVFPNPSDDITSIYFELEASAMIEVMLYDSKGALVKALFSDKAKAGSNIFTFSAASLRTGTYILRVLSGGKEIITEKIMVP